MSLRWWTRCGAVGVVHRLWCLRLHWRWSQRRNRCLLCHGRMLRDRRAADRRSFLGHLTTVVAALLRLWVHIALRRHEALTIGSWDPAWRRRTVVVDLARSAWWGRTGHEARRSLCHGWVQWLALWHNTNSGRRVLTKVLNRVSAPETPLHPSFESSARTHVLPLLLKQLAIFSATPVLHPGEAEDQKRYESPADGTATHRALAHHETAEPEPRLQETKNEETWNDRGDDDDPSLKICLAKVAAAIRAVVRAAARVITAGATTSIVVGSRCAASCRWGATMLDIVAIGKVVA